MDDLSQIERNRIYHADLFDLCAALPEQSVDLIFTSPPYFNARPEYAVYSSYNAYLNFMGDAISELFRVTKCGCFFILNLSPVIIERENRQHQSTRLALPFDIHALVVNRGFDFIDDIIWKKPEPSSIRRNGGFRQHRRPMAYKPNIVTEYVLVYRKHTEKLIDWNIHQHNTEQIKNSLVCDDYETSNIWEIAPESSSDHPAVFPLPLADKIIRYYSFVDDLVFDPFCGSGTTAVAARNCKREFICGDKELDYVEIARARISGRIDEYKAKKEGKPFKTRLF